MKKWTVIALIVLGVGLVVALNIAFFTGRIMGLDETVNAALESNAEVQVESLDDDSRLVFTPVTEAPTLGLILYPEGRMDFRNYAPVSQMIAREGYQVVVLSRRLERSYNRAEEQDRIREVMGLYPEIQSWCLGAHTWGGVVAVDYALSYPDKVVGVVLWAVRMDDLASTEEVEQPLTMADSDLPILYVYGTLDDDNVNLQAGSKAYLPEQTVWVPIEGGNRVQFGTFGPMAADVGASISIEEQQRQAAEATIGFLESLSAE